MMKQLYDCIMTRIHFIEDLCLIKTFKEALTIDSKQHEDHHSKCTRLEKESVELLMAVSNYDEALRISTCVEIQSFMSFH
jgi:hypothetical protein